jgi:hypothetical protein
MSATNPEAARTTHSSAPDTQTLVELLGSLMPLLLQLQSPSPGAAHMGPPQFTVSEPTNLFGTVAPPHPLLDHQAAVEMIEDMNAGALRTLSAYLERYANQHAGLANCVPMVTQAARAFGLRDHAQTFALIWQAYRAIALARAQDRELPSPRVAGQGPQPSSPASMLH